MSKARDMINAHLYPVLATLGTAFLAIGMVNAIQVNQKLAVIEEHCQYFGKVFGVHIQIIMQSLIFKSQSLSSHKCFTIWI